MIASGFLEPESIMFQRHLLERGTKTNIDLFYNPAFLPSNALEIVLHRDELWLFKLLFDEFSAVDLKLVARLAKRWTFIQYMVSKGKEHYLFAKSGGISSAVFQYRHGRLDIARKLAKMGVSISTARHGLYDAAVIGCYERRMPIVFLRKIFEKTDATHAAKKTRYQKNGWKSIIRMCFEMDDELFRKVVLFL
jgi:hypothetical protein